MNVSKSKFIVYKLLLLQLVLRVLTQSATSSQCLRNCYAEAEYEISPSIKVENKIMETTTIAIPNLGTKFKMRDRLNSSSFDGDEEEASEFHYLVTGGYRPNENKLAKYVVSIRKLPQNKFFGDNHICGGSIISESAVLTAAHCLFKKGKITVSPSELIVVAGTPRRLVQTSNTQEVEVKNIKPHPKYSSATLAYDLGLLRLSNNLVIDGTFVAIIPIPTTDTSAGTECTLAGWGALVQYGPLPDEIINGDVTVRSKSHCKKGGAFRKGMICASNPKDYEVDCCQGDSGGPLISNDIVVGIVSHGRGCGIPGSSGVYTDVYYFRNWILNNRAARQLADLICFLPLIVLTIQKPLGM